MGKGGGGKRTSGQKTFALLQDTSGKLPVANKRRCNNKSHSSISHVSKNAVSSSSNHRTIDKSNSNADDDTNFCNDVNSNLLDVAKNKDGRNTCRNKIIVHDTILHNLEMKQDGR